MPRIRFFLSKTILTFTHGWFCRRLILTGLTPVVITTESKSVSLRWRRFETSLQEVVFSSKYTLKIHSWMVSSQPYLNLVLGKMVLAIEFKYLLNCTSAGSKPAGDNVSFLSEHSGLKGSFMDGFLGGPS
jgi:hypothetical protein